jgi:hypothetical protein
MLGIAAALFAGILAIVVLANDVFTPSRPSSVVIIDSGQVICGPIKVNADGRSSVGGRPITNATQVVAVARCRRPCGLRCRIAPYEGSTSIHKFS